MQGVASSEIAGERCIIIGGDPREKLFYPVSNTAEFDLATVSNVAAKYLDPPPPDLFSYDLHWTAPMAEQCYDLIASEKPFPTYLAVEPVLFGLALKDKNREQRLLVYGGFLNHLKSWQGEVMMRGFHRFPFMYNWEGRLLEIVKKYREHLPKRA